ncbi:cytochrome c1 [Aquirhabdus sp.]|uniref:cytochrome c1 n=1 Tax=Aquirhabdus sp. TaxID=2824160 RepID=UPI00396CAD1D
MKITNVKYLFLPTLTLCGAFLIAGSAAHAENCGTFTTPDPAHPGRLIHHDYACQAAPIDITNQASLKRGAELFMTTCVSCHSLKYLRYERMATDLALSPEQIKTYMALTNSKIYDGIDAKTDAEMQKKAFGVAPPDLSLEARSHGPDWIYTYLLSFYPDNKRPLGFNNKVIKDVAMPNVLAGLHQQLGDKAFAAQVADLVNFLNYASEPKQHVRKIYGLFVIGFLLLFLIPVYLLNKEYWKDVK